MSRNSEGAGRAELADFSPKRILVCQLRQIGDVVLATPALELLARRYPEAEIHLLTEKKCAPLLQGNPHLHRIRELDKAALRPLTRELSWYWQLAREGFDLVVDFQQLPRCRWVVAFSRARVRLSYTPPWYNRFLYTHSAPLKEGYSAWMKASVLAPLGIAPNGERPRIYLNESERAEARSRLEALGLQPGQRLITVDPTHRRATRRWPPELYGAALRLLAEADPGLRFLPLWGPGEEGDILPLLEAGPDRSRFLMPETLLSLREMAACMELAALHLGNCSAPRHVAVAVDTPSCIVHGSTSESAWTFPSPRHVSVAAHLPCQPCEENVCPLGEAICLTRLSPEEVAGKARGLLA